MTPNDGSPGIAFSAALEAAAGMSPRDATSATSTVFTSGTSSAAAMYAALSVSVAASSYGVERSNAARPRFGSSSRAICATNCIAAFVTFLPAPLSTLPSTPRASLSAVGASALVASSYLDSRKSIAACRHAGFSLVVKKKTRDAGGWPLPARRESTRRTERTCRSTNSHCCMASVSTGPASGQLPLRAEPLLPRYVRHT
mmetsp:Transcript_17323/g.60925  ORF Transcript_17323/g.60925 Transcript_17323/m.60925 type:complete len:200 (+) Transcript_17323:82-681(+)